MAIMENFAVVESEPSAVHDLYMVKGQAELIDGQVVRLTPAARARGRAETRAGQPPVPPGSRDPLQREPL